MYIRKTRDVWHLYVNYGYGHGWEHEVTENSKAAIRDQQKAYQENCPYPTKIKKVREKIQE